MESREQHLSSVEIYTAPGIFLCEKKTCRVSFSWHFMCFCDFSWLGWKFKIQNSHRRFLQRIPSRTPRLKVLRTQLTCCLRCFSHPGCAAQLQVFPPRVSSGRMVLAWTFLDIQKAYMVPPKKIELSSILYHLMLPSKTKRNSRFLRKTCTKNTSSQKLAEQLSGHGLDKDKVPGSINTFYWG